MIKRGVSLYSYQQEQFFHRMNFKDMIGEVRHALGTDGIEIIADNLIPKYPFPTPQFLFAWNNEMARYHMKAVTMDVFLDVLQFRDHVMNHREAAERLKNDIRIAAAMGFENVRTLSSVPIEVIRLALPTAEKYNVRIGKEIHFPIPIRPGNRKKNKYGMAAVRDFSMVEQILDLRQETGSPYVGLIPDFGIFQHKASKVTVAYERRQAKYPEEVDFLVENRKNYSFDELVELAREKYPDGEMTVMSMERIAIHEPVARPEDLREIVPYIISIHGKFYDMTEIPHQPGRYEDVCMDYEGPIRQLLQWGYDGYINSEYEGQRDQQDLGLEGLADEVEQVRRHHEMLKRLLTEIGKEEGSVSQAPAEGLGR